MAPICIQNYMKQQRLLVAKNVKVNKKCFIVIFDQDYIGKNSSLWMPKKNFVSFISVFSVKMSGIQTEKVGKKWSGITKSRLLQSNFKSTHSSLQWVHVSRPKEW